MDYYIIQYFDHASAATKLRKLCVLNAQGIPQARAQFNPSFLGHELEGQKGIAHNRWLLECWGGGIGRSGPKPAERKSKAGDARALWTDCLALSQQIPREFCCNPPKKDGAHSLSIVGRTKSAFSLCCVDVKMVENIDCNISMLFCRRRRWEELRRGL